MTHCEEYEDEAKQYLKWRNKDYEEALLNYILALKCYINTQDHKNVFKVFNKSMDIISQEKDLEERAYDLKKLLFLFTQQYLQNLTTDLYSSILAISKNELLTTQEITETFLVKLENEYPSAIRSVTGAYLIYTLIITLKIQLLEHEKIKLKKPKQISTVIKRYLQYLALQVTKTEKQPNGNQDLRVRLNTSILLSLYQFTQDSNSNEIFVSLGDQELKILIKNTVKQALKSPIYQVIVLPQVIEISHESNILELLQSFQLPDLEKLKTIIENIPVKNQKQQELLISLKFLLGDKDSLIIENKILQALQNVSSEISLYNLHTLLLEDQKNQDFLISVNHLTLALRNLERNGLVQLRKSQEGLIYVTPFSSDEIETRLLKFLEEKESATIEEMTNAFPDITVTQLTFLLQTLENKGLILHEDTMAEKRYYPLTMSFQG